jgi:serine/threonine protein kinase
LEDVLAERPSWWTSTAKSKTIAGIVLGMQFAHSLGCAHGSLKPSNVIFDQNQNPHIDYCDLNKVEELVVVDDEVSSRSDESQELQAKRIDVFSFASILFGILVGGRVDVQAFRLEGREMIPAFVASFVKDLIEQCWSANPSMRPSFDEIHRVMKENDFDVVEGNDVKEVLAFVSSVESSEY